MLFLRELASHAGQLAEDEERTYIDVRDLQKALPVRMCVHVCVCGSLCLCASERENKNALSMSAILKVRANSQYSFMLVALNMKLIFYNTRP